MKYVYAILAVLLTVSVSANAVIVQTIKLKDGSELSGYIKQQNLDGTMIISSDRAVVCLANSDNSVSISTGTNYGEESLSEAWIEWAEKYDEFEGVKGNRKLLLNDVSVKGGNSATKVKILERGAVVKYLQLEKGVEFSVKWDDVVSIKGERRPKNALSGIDRIFQLKSGVTVEGQYAEETDSTISLYLSNGEIQTYKTLDVVKYTYKAINPNQSIFEQSPLLDVVTCKNGTPPIKGIITEQNYLSNSDEQNYIIVRQEGDIISSIKISDIKNVRKEDNGDKYVPKYDILLSEGDVVVNRGEVVFVNVKENESRIVLDSISRKVTIPVGKGGVTEICVEYRNSNYINVEMFQLVKLTTMKVKKDTIYSFTYKDLASDAVYKATSIETSKNKTTKAVYKVDHSGKFALYDSKSKRAIPVIVK